MFGPVEISVAALLVVNFAYIYRGIIACKIIQFSVHARLVCVRHGFCFCWCLRRNLASLHKKLSDTVPDGATET